MRQASVFLLVVLCWVASSLLLESPGARAAELHLAPADSLPQDVREAPNDVQEAYRFAVANPDLLKAIPCYCGCEMFQHRDNYACYVEDVRPDGEVIFSDHGLG